MASARILLLCLAVAAAADVDDLTKSLFQHAADRKESSAGDVLTLLAKGADPTALTKDGETALHLACIYGSARKVRALLAHGADPNARASQTPASLDMTPLTWCSYAGYADAIAVFIAEDTTDVNLVVREESGGRLTALDIARKIGPRGADAAALLAGAGAKTYAELLADAGGVAAAVPGMPPGDARNDEL